jgi:LacI family repressor for deo operon, udp, cdd, tsx, nupC, and nupG
MNERLGVSQKKRGARTTTSPPTIRDMSAALGLSVATISRVLARPEMVRPETRERVLKAVKEMGYRPNALAQALARNETRLVFFVIPVLSPFFLEVMDGVEMAAQEEGYSVVLANARRDPQRTKLFYDQVVAQRADGILLTTGHLPDALALPSATWPPTVVVAEPLNDPRAIMVCIDHAEAVATAVAHLVKLGHKRIAHITGPSRALSVRERRRGFNQAMADAGLRVPPEWVVEGLFDPESGEAAIAQLCKGRMKPTAVFADNDELAVGAIRGAHRHGLKVPEDLSVIGLDNQRFLEVFEPGLTTIDIPRFEMGYQAMKRLVRCMAGEKNVGGLRLRTELIVRQTTSYPPKSPARTR